MSYLDKIISLDERLKTQYGDDGKLSQTADRRVTNPGESKKQHREDATEFAEKHKKRASDVTPQTGKIPGPKPPRPKPATQKEALVYAMNRWATHLAEAAMLGENQFASRPGGDGTGRQKGAEAVVAAEKKKEQKPSREAMPKTAGGLRRLIRQGR